MPFYSYKCKQCDHQFEARQRMSDDPLTDCPVCAGEVRRLVSQVGIVFKGSGFYVTDNRNGKSKNKDLNTGKKEDKSGENASESATASGNSESKGDAGKGDSNKSDSSKSDSSKSDSKQKKAAPADR